VNLRRIYFVPLCPGEFPGDPELGGWRPLPKQFFRHRNAAALSIEDAVRIVASRLTGFNLTQAITVLAKRF